MTDRSFRALILTTASGVIVLLGAVVLFLIKGAMPAFKAFGAGLALGSEWDPVKENFGALPVIYGTLVSSGLAVMIATPIGVGAALFLNELAPSWMKRPLLTGIQLLAAIPSVIYGLWGIFILAPWLRTMIEPFLIEKLGFIPLFRGYPIGLDLLSASLILSIMILPTITSLTSEIFSSIPWINREAALGLGSTRWESLKIGVLAPAVGAIGAGIMLALGRALGETMAVTMVIGNRAQITGSLLMPAQSMASLIANEYAEATSNLHRSALIGVGFLLLLVSILVSLTAKQILKNKIKRSAA